MLTKRESGSVVVLLSGGIDSTVCAHRAIEQGCLTAVVNYDYGQPGFASEGTAALAWADRHSVECCRFVLALNVAPLRVGVGVVGPRVVPGRNLVLLAHAIHFASSIGAREVWFGANKDDAIAYPDCSPLFVNYADRLARMAGIAVVAPLLYLGKAEVVTEARRLGVDIDATWSCYQPTEGVACGTCNACVARERALRPPCVRCKAPAGTDCHDASGYGADHVERRA